MLKKLVLLAATAATASTLAGGASAHPQTTTPGVVYVVKTIITDNSFKITRDKFTRNGVTRWPRGAEIRFALVNKGTKTYVVEIWGEKTNPIRPGKHDSMLVTWNYRGRFTYRTLYRGKPTSVKGYVVIF